MTTITKLRYTVEPMVALYRPSRRNWIKLWTNEWLTGTIRFQLTKEQRSLWADLLALGGASRFPGIICAGETNGVLDPYPPQYLCGILGWEEKPLRKALDLFKAQGRIKEVKGVLHICNWDKYQSEYHQRLSRKSRKKSQIVAQMSAQKSSVEGEVDGEVEVDGEAEQESLSAKKQQTKTTAPSVPLPAWVPVEQWNAFLDMRKKIRAPLTPYAQTLAIGKLEKLRIQGHDSTAVLEQSIERGWRGLFEVKSSSRKSPGEETADAIERVLAKNPD